MGTPRSAWKYATADSMKAAPVIYAVDAKQLGEPPKVPDDFKG